VSWFRKEKPARPPLHALANTGLFDPPPPYHAFEPTYVLEVIWDEPIIEGDCYSTEVTVDEVACDSFSIQPSGALLCTNKGKPVAAYGSFIAAYWQLDDYDQRVTDEPSGLLEINSDQWLSIGDLLDDVPHVNLFEAPR
jgi:hypothetical protein